ncbi:MAG TPA: DUF4340 domain-containing protein [Candidatus Ozemobacteraceae bacterium]|nr:DUF4340 domain-containing protein [Candidatus Ozemobacteraceae bacterium]
MKKRYLTTVIAVIAFILLFLYANIYEADVIPEPGKDKPVQLAATANADVRALAWQAGGAPEIRIEAVGTGSEKKFSIVKPRALRADNDVAAGIIRAFSDLQSDLTITATETLSFGFGSDSPRLTIETGSATTVLTLGQQAPVGGSVYVQRKDDPNVYVVDNSVVTAFRKSLSDLRDKAIFTEDFTDIASVTVVNGSTTFELAKTSTGWDMSAPVAMPADAGEVSSLIFGIHDLKVDRFVEESTPESAVKGFDTPSYKVVMRTPAGKTFEFAVGAEKDGFAAVKRSGDDEAYLVSLTSLARVKKDFTALRNKNLPAMPPLEVKHLSMRVGTETFELALASNTWSFDGRTIDKSHVESVLQAYANCRVQEFLSDDEKKAHGLDDVKTCDRLVLKSDKAERTVFFGAHEEIEVIIQLEGEKELYRIPRLLHSSILNLADELRKKPEPPQAATASAPAAPASAAVPAPVPNK